MPFERKNEAVEKLTTEIINSGNFQILMIKLILFWFGY